MLVLSGVLFSCFGLPVFGGFFLFGLDFCYLGLDLEFDALVFELLKFANFGCLGVGLSAIGWVWWIVVFGFALGFCVVGLALVLDLFLCWVW